MPIALHYAARSHTGLVRQSNQDSGYAGPHLLVVADGMGGHAAGDVASSIAIGHLVPLDDDSVGSRAMSMLEAALAEANEEIAETTAENPEMAGMGTTVTALLRTGNKLALAHIGDSRAYLLREGTLTQITKDHTYVQRLVDEGQITAEEAEHHPQGNLVTRVLTGQPSDEPDTAWREARKGDRFMLCSDGISGYVGRDTIEDVLKESPSPERAADRLVDLALRSGAPDNATAIVADVVSLATSSAPSQSPQVVGAATAHKNVVVVPPRTPAEKAAALAREASGATVAAPVALAEEDAGRGRALRRALVVALLVLIVLAAAGYGFYRWTRTQFFLAPQDGKVAVHQGLDQSLLGLQLSNVAETSSVSIDDLPAFYRNRVESHVAASSLADARRTVADLAVQAKECHVVKAKGGHCGDTGVVTTVPSVSPSASPSASTSTPPATSPATASTSATTPAAKPASPKVTP